MKDREVILRYLSFRWFDYQNEYTGDMSDFVEKAMKKINKMDDEKITEIKEDFERVMKWSFKIWNIGNFRIPTEFTRGTINTAILESVCVFLSFTSNDYLEKNQEVIRFNYNNLILDSVYFEAVTKSTGNKAKVLDRFRLAKEILIQDTI
mgnify:FL=1